jgi:hypothetical protein
MAWVEQTGQASWRVRFRRVGGTVGSVPGFASRRSAEAHAADVESDQRRRVWIDPAGGRLELRSWVQRWLPVQDLDPRTVDNYEKGGLPQLCPSGISGEEWPRSYRTSDAAGRRPGPGSSRAGSGPAVSCNRGRCHERRWLRGSSRAEVLLRVAHRGATSAWPASRMVAIAASRCSRGPLLLAGRAQARAAVYAPDQAGAVVAAADTSDYVAVVGEKASAEGLGDNPAPALAPDQQALVSALEATGKPVVVAGRPVGLGPAEKANAVLMACQGSTEAGAAVADVLFGKTNPAGRLPISRPSDAPDVGGDFAGTRTRSRPSDRESGNLSPRGPSCRSWRVRSRLRRRPCRWW